MQVAAMNPNDHDGVGRHLGNGTREIDDHRVPPHNLLGEAKSDEIIPSSPPRHPNEVAISFEGNPRDFHRSPHAPAATVSEDRSFPLSLLTTVVVVMEFRECHQEFPRKAMNGECARKKHGLAGRDEAVQTSGECRLPEDQQRQARLPSNPGE